MKKLSAILLAIALLLSFAACGGNETPETTTEATVETTTEAPVETTTEAPVTEAVTDEPITTEKGYVTVTPCGGFVYDENETTDKKVALKNASLGAHAAVYVFDEQSMELDAQKKYFSYAYPNKEYTTVTIGDNTFEAIESNTGITYLVAETSTGYAMYVAVWSCSVEDAMPVLETIVIG
ncbi:MAG: hypothetical protein IJB86_03765 [Clostridia bacterium]|nr:hypothetical protein [Clostridia bacterium]